jgi:DNA-binding NarL/FixJ family response regulator
VSHAAATVAIVVIDDHAVVREGLAAILSDEPSFRVVATVESCDAASPEIERLRPRVVVIDDGLPGAHEYCASLTARYPNVRAILAATFAEESGVVRARGSGAHGVVLKDSEPSTIRDAVRAVARGATFLDPRAAPEGRRSHADAHRPFGLTPRERAVLRLLPRGLTNRAIGAELWISEDTVKTHMKAILLKLGARDRAEAAVIAVREGLV